MDSQELEIFGTFKFINGMMSKFFDEGVGEFDFEEDVLTSLPAPAGRFVPTRAAPFQRPRTSAGLRAAPARCPK